MADAPRRLGREGSRWYNQRPTAQDIAEWWQTIPLHEGMKHEDYIGGVTLIPAKEKSDEVTGWDNAGLPQIRERQDLVFVPYVKVETRVAYFWQLMALHPEWRGSIDPVLPTAGADSLGLPPGFFRYAAAKPDGKVVNFVGQSMRVSVWERSRTSSQDVLITNAPPASKIVATATRWDVDQNALMKAETGAIGRALGMAGILVVPGSGVATAEDMQDAAVPTGAAPEPQLPDTATAVQTEATDEELRERAAELVSQLSARAPEKHQAFQEWARGRKLTLDNAHGPALKGAVKKLEKTIAELDAVPA